VSMKARLAAAGLNHRGAQPRSGRSRRRGRPDCFGPGQRRRDPAPASAVTARRRSWRAGLRLERRSS